MFFLGFDIFAFSQNPKLLAAANTPIKLNIEDWPRGEKTVNLSDSPIHNPHAIGRHSEGESLLVSRKRETQKKGGFSIWWQTCIKGGPIYHPQAWEAVFGKCVKWGGTVDQIRIAGPSYILIFGRRLVLSCRQAVVQIKSGGYRGKISNAQRATLTAEFLR